MIDNKPFEDEAESFVKNKLLRYGFNMAKPSFDIKGADLLILDNIDTQYSKILKIQSKGRTLKKTTNSIKIHESYVKDDFIVFLYAIDEINKEQEYLLTFFKEDIQKWNKKNNHYILSFTSENILNDSSQSNIFNNSIADKIKQLLDVSKIKKLTSVIIDGIFLEKAISDNLSTYQEMYPEKKLTKPSIKNVILNIALMCNKYKSEENIINYHIYNYNENIDCSKVVDSNLIISDDIENRLYIHETNELIIKEIKEYFQKVINLENIIFVADDIIYEPMLNKLKNDGIDVSLVMLDELRGNNMFTQHDWGNIDIPIAKSLGLERYEW